MMILLTVNAFCHICRSKHILLKGTETLTYPDNNEFNCFAYLVSFKDLFHEIRDKEASHSLSCQRPIQIFHFCFHRASMIVNDHTYINI